MVQPTIARHNEGLTPVNKPSLQLKPEEPRAPLGVFVLDALAAIVIEQGVPHENAALADALNLASVVDAVETLVHVPLVQPTMAKHNSKLIPVNKPSL